MKILHLSIIVFLLAMMFFPFNAILAQNQPTIEFDQASYSTKSMSCNPYQQKITAQTTEHNRVTIIVTDPNANKFSTSIDRVVVSVWSDSDRKGIEITAYETDVNSGIFKGKVTISDGQSTQDIIHVRDGDTLSARYAGTTSGSDTTSHGITTTSFIGISCPPLERVPASSIRILDLKGNEHNVTTVGKQVLIVSDISNPTPVNQNFTYIVQIQDKNGSMSSLAWLSGTMLPNQTSSPSVSWTPSKTGNYAVSVFVWQSLTNPNALSPPLSADLTVLHDAATSETMVDKQFVSNLPVVVNEPICIGGPGMCGPQPTPQEKKARTYLDFPFDVTTDNLGNIYVADSGNDRIVKFDPYENYLMQFGVSGKDDGQFMDPRGVAVDKSGNLYVADTINDRIQKFDSAGKFVLKFGTHGVDDGQFHGPYSVAVDKSGSIYVADVGNARIEKFDANGNFILKFGTRGQEKGELDGIERIAIGDFGYLYVTSTYQGVQKFDSTGHFVQEISLKPTLDGNNAPDAWGVALAEKGAIYVAGYNQARIQKFNSQGNFEYEFGSFGSQVGEFNHPGNIAVDNSGNVLVADSDNNRIEKLDSSGKFVSQIHDWSVAKDLQTMPEFPFAVPVMLIGIVSVIAFYRMRFGK